MLLTLLYISGHECSLDPPHADEGLEVAPRYAVLPADAMGNEFTTFNPASNRFCGDLKMLGRLRDGEQWLDRTGGNVGISGHNWVHSFVWSGC